MESNLQTNAALPELYYDEENTYVKETALAGFLTNFIRNKMAIVGAAIILVLIIVGIFAPIIAPHDPYLVNLNILFQKPSARYLLGTDMYGRDVLSRIIYGSRVSLVIGLIPTTMSMIIGATLGMISGFYGKKTDYLIMRLCDVVMAFPSLLLAMVVMYTLGGGLLNIFIALSIVGWAGTARVVRAQTLALKEKEYVEGARAIGVRNWVIIARHILPNCIHSLLVLFTMGIPDAILSESSLSFLGVGAQPPTPSWGLMVSTGKEFMFQAPWIAVAPGVAILIVVLAFNFLGDGIRDALDPYMKQ